MSRPTKRDLVKAALTLARSGQPVFPCRSEGESAKAPLIAGGLKSASTDPETVKDWWRKYPRAAIGIPTGIVWDVLDVDIKETADGRAHLPYLTRLGLLDGCRFVVRTPSGGYHLYFRASGLRNKGRAASLGLDVRASGGYVIAPPSYLVTEEYEGAYEHMGETEESTDDPLFWDLIQTAVSPTNTETKKPIDLPPGEHQASLAHLRRWLSERIPGERNNALHWAVWRCIDSGIDPHELVDVALLIGLHEEEIEKTIGSALKRAGKTVDDLRSEVDALFGDD